MLGLAAVVDPLLALAGTVAAVLAGIVVVSPIVGVCMLLALSFFEEVAAATEGRP